MGVTTVVEDTSRNFADNSTGQTTQGTEHQVNQAYAATGVETQHRDELGYGQ